MAQLKGKLLVNKTWNAQRRYKIGQSVGYLGNVYTNATGNNSIPGTNDDWVSQSNGLEYTPENESNKQDSLDEDGTGVKYPTVDAVKSEIDNIKSQIDKTTFIISDNGYLKTGLHINVFADWEWQIKGVYYTNPSDFEYDITLCSSGKSRFDIITLTDGVGMSLHQGDESETTPTVPSNPFNEIIAITLLVTDSGASGVPIATNPVSQSITNGVIDKSPSENAVFYALELKQAALVSGTNIKTINGTSLLGSGNIVVSGSGARIYNVKDYGALGDGSTDDTSAIQTTINTVFAAGGGVVYFPIGIYIIGGALQTSISGINYNSQLYIPQVNSNDSGRCTISFLGEVQPNLAQTLGINSWIAPNSGVILRSTIQGSGTRPSVICNRGASGNNIANFSYTNVSFKNFSIQITPNGSSKMTMGGINCEFSAVAMFENITCFPYNLNLVSSGKPDIIDIVGISTPSVNCELNNTIINCNVGGFTNGFLLGEHVSLFNAVAICCLNGFNQIQNYHLGNYTKISAFWCSVDFIVTGASYFNIMNLQTEWTIAGKWYDATATLSDSSNLGHGHFNYNIISAGVGADQTKFIKIGGSKIKTKPICIDSINKNIPATSYTFGATDADIELITATNASSISLTLNNDTYFNFDIGCSINVMQNGAGQITFVAGSGVTINTAETLKTRKQSSTVSLVKISANTWLLTGDLELL